MSKEALHEQLQEELESTLHSTLEGEVTDDVLDTLYMRVPYLDEHGVRVESIVRDNLEAMADKISYEVGGAYVKNRMQQLKEESYDEE